MDNEATEGEGSPPHPTARMDSTHSYLSHHIYTGPATCRSVRSGDTHYWTTVTRAWTCSKVGKGVQRQGDVPEPLACTQSTHRSASHTRQQTTQLLHHEGPEAWKEAWKAQHLSHTTTPQGQNVTQWLTPSAPTPSFCTQHLFLAELLGAAQEVRAL